MKVIHCGVYTAASTLVDLATQFLELLPVLPPLRPVALKTTLFNLNELARLGIRRMRVHQSRSRNKDCYVVVIL
jgi:hypothetical protein